jgi:hypothetical protein
MLNKNIQMIEAERIRENKKGRIINMKRQDRAREKKGRGKRNGGRENEEVKNIISRDLNEVITLKKNYSEIINMALSILFSVSKKRTICLRGVDFNENSGRLL